MLPPVQCFLLKVHKVKPFNWFLAFIEPSGSKTQLRGEILSNRVTHLAWVAVCCCLRESESEWNFCQGFPSCCLTDGWFVIWQSEETQMMLAMAPTQFGFCACIMPSIYLADCLALMPCKHPSFVPNPHFVWWCDALPLFINSRQQPTINNSTGQPWPASHQEARTDCDATWQRYIAPRPSPPTHRHHHHRHSVFSF